jgi:tryptophan synthase beta chain
VILFNLSGHGNFDLQAYDDYLNDRLVDLDYSKDEVEKALAGLRQP